jgi:hypothetical protein
VTFYSARLILIILVDDGQPRKTHTWDEIVVTFRARNFDHAFVRALEIGRSHEVAYRNAHGQRVRWALVEIENLDRIGRRLDATEVASRLKPRRSKTTIPFSRRFHPEKSKPAQSF